MTGTPRCYAPMAAYELARPADSLDVAQRDPVTERCWRPAGHAGTRHMSRPSYLRMLAYHRAWKRAAYARRREMTAAGDRTGS